MSRWIISENGLGIVIKKIESSDSKRIKDKNKNILAFEYPITITFSLSLSLSVILSDLHLNRVTLKFISSITSIPLLGHA